MDQEPQLAIVDNDEVQPLRLHVELDRRVNYAMQQNDVPVIKALHIENVSDDSMHELRITIASDPAFADAWATTISVIPPRSTFNVEGVDLRLSPSILGELTERLAGRLLLTVSGEGVPDLAHVEPVELLAADEWSGGNSLPEILAAFVTPNHPALGPILKSAAGLLESWTQDSALSGYQSKSTKRTWQMAAAVYTAIRDQQFSYVNPPPSFELDGQRVRLPGRLVEQGMGTCLDMALLAAAGLEAIGLHPIVVLMDGHAFCGVWLVEQSFPEAACDDALRLRKRVELNEIVVFDPTLAASSSRPDFQAAVDEAARLLQCDDELSYFIDVHRARIGRIRPLPERVEQSDGAASGSDAEGATTVAPPSIPDASRFAQEDALRAEQVPEPGSETPQSRIDRWQSRLLDLSLRNRLLNFKETKKTVPLLCPDLGTLEDQLANGRSFSVLPRPEDLGQGDPRDEDVHRRRTGLEARSSVLNEDLLAGRLHTDLTEDVTRRRLTELYRAARVSLEEGGSSELFLAIGMLGWYQTEHSEDRRLAPILMLPVTLVRRSVHEGFQLRASDDDPIINVTLLELLQREHGITISGLDPLPGDDSGVDVAAVLRRFREAVVGVDRWEVVEEAWVGLFSFTKFLMWKDLTARKDDLMRNVVVDHLVNRPRESFPSSGALPEPDRLDFDRKPSEIFCPMSADSSQLAAVMAAAEGRSFVLEGPPGTGKSQTITNLIAHCLAEGKRVLFVSEKMAALSVVKRRLNQVGLGRFCLELHSNKVSKPKVLKQLKEALDGVREQSGDDWEREARRLEALRNELNAYVQALHLRRNSGETFFQVTSRAIGLSDVRRVPLKFGSHTDVDADRLDSLRLHVDRLATAGDACRGLSGHPWKAVQRGDWKPGWEEHCLEEVERLGTSVRSMAEVIHSVEGDLGLDAAVLSHEDLGLVDELCEILLGCPGPPRAILVDPEWDQIQEQLENWIQHGRARDALRAKVFSHFTNDVLDLACDGLLTQLRIAEASSWPASWWRRRPVKAALRQVSKEGKAPDAKRFKGVLERIASLQEEEGLLQSAGENARSLLDRHWKGGEADWDGLASIHDWARRFRSIAQRMARGDRDRAAELRSRWAELSTDGAELLMADQALGRALRTLRESHGPVMASLAKCKELLDLDETRAWGGVGEPGVLDRLERVTGDWRRGRSRLREWCSYRDERGGAVAQGLLPLIDLYEQGEFSGEELPDVFEHSYGKWWLVSVMDSEPVLAGFSSPEHERKIREFREVDDRYTDLTQRIIAARLAAKVPSGNTNLKKSQVGILTREVTKKKRHMPVRKLFAQIPDLLSRLKPCLLMSPISIAQYLDTSFSSLDLVVFDEASQIPVWDAIGAIARGDQLVVVGDPKQLPPTSFFQRAGDDEDVGDDQVEDMESILDDCMSAQVPLVHLDWHYRSRHESLIALSNHYYYDNNLLTFPAADRDGLGVSWRHVADGVYDKGKSRTNRGEAEALVADIVRRLRDPLQQGFTIGVVTFSQAQQALVENLLDQARLENSELERFFSEDVLEPVFVKNLENVQGDERDVILFSICYGPDRQGRVSMAFGPLNRTGGERRLNVAITRARRELVVFSTITSDQIDLKRTNARGVQDLKVFLDYAHRGMNAIAEATQFHGGEDFDSPFEAKVHKALSARGWEVHPQVGCSGYRIDLAVVDPELPGRYLLGVECDGAHYHSGKTARDRDKLREGVLRDLGWEIHRIWSTDWWTDPAREVEKLETAIAVAKKAHAGVIAERAAAAERALDPVNIEDREAVAPLDSFSLAAGSTAVQKLKMAAGDAPVAEGDHVDDRVPEEAQPSLPVYSSAYGAPPSSMGFYEPVAAEGLWLRTADVVAAEAPVLLSLVAKRVGAAWGLGRVSSKAVSHIESILDRKCAMGNASIMVERDPAGELVLWRSSDTPAEWGGLRVPGPGPEDARSVPEVPLIELANAVAYVLEQHISLPESDLAREAARVLGVGRMGHKVKKRMLMAIARVVERGQATQDDDTVTVIG